VNASFARGFLLSPGPPTAITRMRSAVFATLLAIGLWFGPLHAGDETDRSAQTPAPVKPDVAYIPTPQVVVDAMLRLAQVTPSDIVYDLGSGDGRIVIAAAANYGARGVGIEIDPALVGKATENARAAGVSDRVQFVNQNLFTADIRQASVVTLYLLQSLNERLRPRLLTELKPGTRVVSHVFDMGPEWPPDESVMVGFSPLFLWTIRSPTDGRVGAAPR